MPERNLIRFGVVGCGSASIPVCGAIARSSVAELVSVFDVNETLAEDLSQRFQVHKMSTFSELLADDEIDAVYVAVPHHLLATLTRQVLEAGKHALTEKPLAISLEQVDFLMSLARQKGLVLGVFYEMRYAPAHFAAHQLVQAGAIGEIIGVQIQTLIEKPLSYWQSGYTSRSINPWRGIKAQAGGGVVLMNTSHLLDALGYITGLAVISVSAEVGTLASNVEVEDMAAATFRFSNGAIGSLIAGAHIWGAYQDECVHLFGTKGQMRLPDPYGADPLQIYLNEPWSDLPVQRWHTVPIEPVSVHQLAIDDFAEAVLSGEPAPIDAEAARRVLAIVLSLYESAAARRTILV